MLQRSDAKTTGALAKNINTVDVERGAVGTNPVAQEEKTADNAVVVMLLPAQAARLARLLHSANILIVQVMEWLTNQASTGSPAAMEIKCLTEPPGQLVVHHIRVVIRRHHRRL